MINESADNSLNNIANDIKDIVLEEFSRVITLIEEDLQKNYQKKMNNFLLSSLDDQIKAQMVFVSSFESKSGFAIEKCAKRIARLKYGEENVPPIVNPRHLVHNVDPTTVENQIVITDVDTNNGDLQGKITAFRAKRVAKGRGQTRNESSVTQESIRYYLVPLADAYKTNVIHQKPVDLAFFDGTDWNVLELKAGGDLDSSNAPSNVEKLLTIFTDMGIHNCNAYFATLYNKCGEGNNWNGTVKKHLNYPSMFLIGKDFWNKILPTGINFETFTQIYREALEDLNFSNRINSLIETCANA